MADKAEKKTYAHLFKDGKAEPEVPTEPAESDEDLGPCAAIAKNKWVTALTIRHAGKPWESFQFSYLGVRSVFEPTRFEVEFVSHDERYKVVVAGRNLERLYNLVIQSRMESLRAADRDFAADGQPIVTKIEVVKVEEKKRG